MCALPKTTALSATDPVRKERASSSPGQEVDAGGVGRSRRALYAIHAEHRGRGILSSLAYLGQAAGGAGCFVG
jgi:hypothetical protein